MILIVTNEVAMKEDDTENAEVTKGVARFYVSQVIQHKYNGRGRIVAIEEPFYVIQFKNEVRKVPINYQEMDAVVTDTDPLVERVKIAVREVLGDYGWIDEDLEMGKRWRGGVLKLIPGLAGNQEKEIPLEAFFKKIIGIREKLRVLEQKINNHTSLEMDEKYELQAYITRCYGSLTTFNVLFAESTSHFVGSATKEPS